MWRHQAIFLTLCSLAAGMLDMTHICKDKSIGEKVPSPFDCQAYFICDTVPQLHYCTEGLHFDNERKLCNLPIDAKCVIETIKTEIVGEIDNKVENIENTDEVKKENEAEDNATSNSDNDKDSAQILDVIDSNTETGERPHSIFIAFDINNGQAIDPMTDYDTNHIVCRHFGAYFLPHPTNCRKYFICAYGHLHEHHCGRGTLWNYKRMECELSSEAQCFSGSEEITTWLPISTTPPSTDWTRTTTPPSTDWTRTTTPPSTDWTRTTTPPSTDWTRTTTPSTTPTTPIYTLTTCIPIYTTAYIPTQTTPITHSTYTTPTVIITTDTWTPTTPQQPTTLLTTERPTTVVTTNETPSWTTQQSRDDISTEQTIKCPSSRQAYLPHPKDCNKYFICILDMPILTSCPSGLYWDQNAEFCDTAENVHCFQGSK